MFENPEQAFGGARPMLELIDCVYAAVQEPESWDDVLERISATIMGESISLFAGFPDGATPSIMAIQRTEPAAWQDYANHYCKVNPLMAKGEGFFKPNETWYSHPVITESEFEKTEFYNDFFRRYDMYHTAALRITLNGPPANLTCQRPKAKGAFGEQANVVLQVLQPHIKTALSLHQKISNMQAQTLGLEKALEAHGHAVIGLDSSGKVQICNRPASALMEAGTGIRMAHGRLTCASGEDGRALESLVDTVLTGGSGGYMLVGQGAKSALRVKVSAFRSALPGRGESLAALVFLSGPALVAPSRAETMRALYGLTPTESRVADLLLEGLEVRDVAGRMRLTWETTRFHIKRVLAKSGVRRQSELVRLMLSLPGVA
jgi:DNA-binding CsgD family transcriptional regulator